MKNTIAKKLLKTVNTLLTSFVCVLLLNTPSYAIETTTYYHHDGLGSTVAASDVEGNLLWREDYQPYGSRVRNPGSADNTLWFTGKPEEPSLGLQYFGARWYDPVAGRFTGIDPVGFKEGNIHSFNRYAYANNNPYLYVDPDGRSSLTVHPNSASDWRVMGNGINNYLGRVFSGEIASASADRMAGIINNYLQNPNSSEAREALGKEFIGVGGITKSVNSVAKSQRAATREAKRQAGIPTSQQAISQQSATVGGKKIGRQQTFEVQGPGGGVQRKSVQISRDIRGKHAGQPQVEAGNVKPGGQLDAGSRPRIENTGKVRVDFE